MRQKSPPGLHGVCSIQPHYLLSGMHKRSSNALKIFITEKPKVARFYKRGADRTKSTVGACSQTAEYRAGCIARHEHAAKRNANVYRDKPELRMHRLLHDHLSLELESFFYNFSYRPNISGTPSLFGIFFDTCLPEDLIFLVLLRHLESFQQALSYRPNNPNYPSFTKSTNSDSVNPFYNSSSCPSDKKHPSL